MNKPIDMSSPQIEVIPATGEQEPILANLLELYAHDFSEFFPLDIGPDGRFGYNSLPIYWTEAGRHPFLVRVDGKWAGLALVKKGSEVSGSTTTWDMAEFFVLRGYRRRGIGSRIACEIWRQLAGPWEVRVMQSNRVAHLFWARAISTFLGRESQSNRVKKDNNDWEVFSFYSGADG